MGAENLGYFCTSPKIMADLTERSLKFRTMNGIFLSSPYRFETQSKCDMSNTANVTRFSQSHGVG
jgi:hypothetical protein